MLEDITWWLKRVSRRIGQLRTSLVLRGWRGTVGHVALRRANATGDPARTAVPLPDDRRRVLIVDETAPVPSRDSGSLRLHAMMQLLAEDGWDVHLCCDDGGISAHDAKRFAEIGVSAHAGSPLDWLRRYGATLDATVLCRAPVADQYTASVRRHAAQSTLVFDTVDLHFLREQRAAQVLGRASPGRLATNRRKELELVAASDLCLVVSQHERDLLAKELPCSRIEVLSNIHEVYGRSASLHGRQDLLFVGGFSHPPNLDAMQWFVEAILPAINRRLPAVGLHIVGRLTPAAEKTLTRAKVLLHGQVDDISPLMAQCRVSVAPLRFGAGVKGKVNMAMSYGLPVVATSVAAEGIHLADGADALIADTAEAFAEAVVRLYTDPDLWLRLSDAGLANVQRHFSYDVARTTLRRLLPAGSAAERLG